MGHAPTHTVFYRLFCPENTLEITYSRSVPLNSLGYICYWSLVSFASAVLVLKLLKVFQFEWRPRVTYVMAGCQVTSLWMVFSDLCLAFSTVNMSSCSSSKFPLVEILMLGSWILTPFNGLPKKTQQQFGLRYFITCYLQGIVMGTEYY